MLSVAGLTASWAALQGRGVRLALTALAALAGAPLAAASPATVSGYHLEYAFRGGKGDTAMPQGPLIKVGGKLYGMAGSRVVFSFDPITGAETQVHSFDGGADGEFPSGGLIDVGGTFYGTTFAGGGAENGGTVISLDPNSGAETVVYSFTGGADGASPSAGLIEAGGLLYGTAFARGSSGFGTVFKIDPATKTETVVYAFSGGGDGQHPFSSLIKLRDALYGTTEGGGSPNCDGGCGTVFRIDLTTGTERVVYAFKGGDDGEASQAGLIVVGDVVYGVTESGGACAKAVFGCGTVFSLDPVNGAKTVVYAFKGGVDGRSPKAAPIEAGGLLYGTTVKGGAHEFGTVFSLNPATAAETVSHTFRRGSDGANPEGSLVYKGHGLYGTTLVGGRYVKCPQAGCGTLFVVRP